MGLLFLTDQIDFKYWQVCKNAFIKLSLLIFCSITMSENLPTNSQDHSANQDLLDQVKASYHFILVAAILQNRRRNLHVIMFKQRVLVGALIITNVIKKKKKGKGLLKLFNVNQIKMKKTVQPQAIRQFHSTCNLSDDHPIPNLHWTCLCI